MLTSRPCLPSKTRFPHSLSAAGFPPSTIRQRDPDWHALPVPALITLMPNSSFLGLGPGERGANRTGRPFTGDVAGELLYPALHRFGFASVAEPLAPINGPILQ